MGDKSQGPGDTSLVIPHMAEWLLPWEPAVNCWSYLRGLAFLSSSTDRAWKLLHPALTELLPAALPTDTCW